MTYHPLESIVDQHLTQDMANFQLSRSLVSVGYYVNVETRSSIPHSHPYFEFILVRRGICEYHVNGGIFLLHPDEMLMIAPETVHTMRCREDASSYERLILQVNADFMSQVLAFTGLDEQKLPIPPLHILRADAVCRWGIRELIERINASSSIDASLRERLYLCQLGELILTVVNISHSTEGQPFGSINALISEVTIFIQEHFREPELNIARLAGHFYVSREHLSRSFRNVVGESISHYITDLRMQEFRYGLLVGKSILDACRESGFSDYSSFVKSFRKLYGITPMEYREQLRNAMNGVSAEETG